MATEFQDKLHYAMFKGAGAYRTGNAFDVRWSEITLAALRAAGVLDNMVDGLVPPVDTDLLWLDKNHDPAQLKVWDSTGLTWVLATFAKLFDRNVHTLKVTPLVRLSGSANLISVVEPADFFDGLLYSVTPVESNTGNMFITVQGVGTYPVMYANDQHIQPNEMRADAVKVLLYYGSKFYVLFPTADAFNAMLAAQAAAAEAESYRDQAAGYVNDIVSEKEVPITATRNGMASILLPPGMISLEVRGFAAIGDGGRARYRRISFADLVGFPALSYIRSLDRFMPNETIDVVNGGYWLIDENEIIPQMLGAVVDGVTDATAACNAAAALADIIGADLRFTAGKHALDPANGSALSVATYAHGDASLQAALVLPYKVRVRTSGTLTELLIKNLDSATSVGVAIGEDGTTGAGYSQQSFHCDGFMIRAIASTGRYGVVSPKNADLFNRKRPKYQLDHIHFAGQSDNKTVLQSPDEGWAVGVLIGDTYGYDGKITGQGTFLATANPAGQHQMTGFKASAAVGGFGVRPKMIMKSVYAGIDISDGVEGFSITDSEIWDSFRGVITSNALSEPGGFIDNVHTNCVRENFRFSNRSQIHIGKVECYRADGYYTDGATAWYGIRAIASEIDVGTVHGNVGDTFNAETAPALVHADSTSVVTVEQWRSRGLRRVAVFDGSPDCRLGDGTINNTTAIDTIIALGDGASDIQGGNVRVRAGSVSNYFTIAGTVDKRRLTFPRTTSITIPKHDEIAPTAAGTTTVKPRLTASDWQVAMQAGSGAHTYDVILDHASAIDGDEVTVKVIGSSSANPTLRICSGSTATVLSSFNNITGTKRLWCRYVYSAANNLWREIIADSVESTY